MHEPGLGVAGRRRKQRAVELLTLLGVEPAEHHRRKLAHDDGKCVIVVTHSKEVAAASDEVLHLKRGNLTT
ncbi:hypothetical protein AB0I84_22645 [Streptomyces spectabilis]|uniref:hypothetical protein n=1 Tax=Streptomyces spectabilis TaxID=68270 RepID=UPI0033FCA4BD